MHSQPQPHGVQVHVFNKRDDVGSVFHSAFGHRRVDCSFRQVRIDRRDEPVLFEHLVVRQGDVGVDDAAHVPQGRLVAVRVGSFGHERLDLGGITCDVGGQVGDDAGRGDHAQLFCAAGQTRCTAGQGEGRGACCRDPQQSADLHLEVRRRWIQTAAAPTVSRPRPTAPVAPRPFTPVRGSAHGSPAGCCAGEAESSAVCSPV